MRLTQYINRSLFMLLLLLGGMSLSAQEGGTTKEDIRTVKIAHITKALDLTSKEATSFWPVYNEYHRERRKLKNADEGVSGKEKMMALEQAYIKDLKGILSAEKVDLLYKAEEDFKQMLIKILKDRSQER